MHYTLVSKKKHYWMPDNPLLIINEILGRNPSIGYNPSVDGYTCPFTETTCIKRAHSNEGNEPYPVCSVRTRGGKIVAVCPKRFLEVDYLGDVSKVLWSEKSLEHLRVASEVQMEGFGNVDFVIAEIDDENNVSDFISCELQAVDLTGTVWPSYEAIISGEKTTRVKKPYGPNWKNVSKRFIRQLIDKGFYHQRWDAKIVAILQDEVYDYFKRDSDFMTVAVTNERANVFFITYEFEEYEGGPRKHRLSLKDVEATHHSNLQNAALYKSNLHREDFQRVIERRLGLNNQ